MKIESHQLFTSASPATAIGRFGQFPVIRIFIAILFLVPVTALHLGTKALMDMAPESVGAWLRYIDTIIFFGLFFLAYKIYVRVVEKRQALEISSAGWLKETGAGFLIGGCLLTSIVMILALLGYYKIVEFNSPLILLTGFITFGMGAFIEELIFRLILFRLIEEFFGSWTALIVLAVFFGFAHIINPNATVITSLAIVLEAGILIGAAFMYTRRLWLVFGIHFAWNYFQSVIWGVRTSGEEFTGLIKPDIQGPVWLTGGDFGTEASILTVVFCLAIGVIILRLAIKRGQVVSPAWRRKKLETMSATE